LRTLGIIGDDTWRARRSLLIAPTPTREDTAPIWVGVVPPRAPAVVTVTTFVWNALTPLPIAPLVAPAGSVPTATRASRAKLTALSLRRLRGGLFKLELELLQDMVTGGINIARVTALSHCAHDIEVVDVLKVTARER
jgi:hypothetical protein